MENFRIQDPDPDPYNNSYGSASQGQILSLKRKNMYNSCPPHCRTTTLSSVDRYWHYRGEIYYKTAVRLIVGQQHFHLWTTIGIKKTINMHGPKLNLTRKISKNFNFWYIKMAIMLQMTLKLGQDVYFHYISWEIWI